MSTTPQDNSVEQRRRLLKGALGASTVFTLGYGGSAAAASMSCVAKVRDMVSDGPPAGTLQFTMTVPAASTTESNWGWVKVKVESYKLSTGPAFGAFKVNSNVYKTTAPDIPVLGATLANNQNGYPKDGWVLAYFTDSGELVGTYPDYQLAAYGATPAAKSCLASVNPGAVSNFTFGG
jgi:hypothetical protein